MTKKELIEKLAPYDDDVVIALYVQEDMNMARALKLEKRGEESLYCKADHVLTWEESLQEVLIIMD